MDTHYDALVSSIYSCAVDPALWPQALDNLRDVLNADCVFVDYQDLRQTPENLPVPPRKNGPCDELWLDQLHSNLSHLPGVEMLAGLETDEAWILSSHSPDPKVPTSKFYQEWMKPQNLRDILVLRNSSDDTSFCSLWITVGEHRGPFKESERHMVERLSPHIRRSLLINDMTANGRVAQALYGKVLDSLSVPVFVVGSGRRLVFTNGSGDALLSDGGQISVANGHLRTCGTQGQTSEFDDVLDRALKGDTSIGVSGMGVLLHGRDDSRVAAYVLPLNRINLEGTFGEGHCVVFISRRGEHHPMAAEVLRALFNMTKTEARVALLIARGDGPQAICETLDISINTVRTHLRRAYAKTSTPDQTALGGLVNHMLLPIG